MGVNHSTQGAVTVAAINNLALITGNIGRAGAAPFSITGQCNAMGTRESGFTSSPAGLSQVRKPRATAKNSPPSGASTSTRIPAARGLAYPDIIEARRRGKIKALWFIATNPAVSFPNYRLLEQALRTVEFLVVQDGFHPTPTSDFAHLVLPAAIWGEKEGTYTNSERRISKVNAWSQPARRSPARFRHLSRDRGAAGRARRAVSRLDDDARCLAASGSASPQAACATTAPSPGSEIEDSKADSQWGGERLYSDGVFPTRDWPGDAAQRALPAVCRAAQRRV